jgi:quercetin dioxygenase-like cupin family protein
VRVPELIASPSRVAAAGTRPKLIDEVVGRVNTGTTAMSVAHMRSPAGWVEPGQRPEFDEVTYVLSGAVRVEHEGGTIEVAAGQAVLTRAGEWVRYATPEGAEYIAVCVPAFSPDTVHRDLVGGPDAG